MNTDKIPTHTEETAMIKTNDPDARYLRKIYDIYDPWIAATPEREAWLVTCPSGTVVTLMIPLGAAIEIEAKGHKIVAAN